MDSPTASATPTAVETDQELERQVPKRYSTPLPSQYFDFGEPPVKYEAYTISVSSGAPLVTEMKSPQKVGFLASIRRKKRTIIAGLVFLVLVVALGAGLGVGLKHHGSNSSSDSLKASDSASSASSSTSKTNGSSTDTTDSAGFPIGSYAIETFLDTIATDCTSNSSTWRCYPYSTYAESTTKSAATFDWVIEASPESDGGYVISSTSNLFAIVFSNLTLEFHDEGQSSERYTFQVQLEKTVVPSVAITSDGSAASCNYTTTFQGTLYTEMQKTYPADDSATDSTYSPWPYAVRVEEIAGSGEGQPLCYDSSNNIVGNFSLESNAQLCDCLYLNYGT